MAFGDDRLRYAKRALDGIALGDCFGQTFFVPDEIACKRIRDREILEEPWYFTDDTVMAIGIYRILEKYGNINQDELAKVFCRKLRAGLAPGIWRDGSFHSAQYRGREGLAGSCH